MCGREPNFELPEEEKQELRKFNWDEFLAMTRNTITNRSKSLLYYLTIAVTSHLDRMSYLSSLSSEQKRLNPESKKSELSSPGNDDSNKRRTSSLTSHL